MNYLNHSALWDRVIDIAIVYFFTNNLTIKLGIFTNEAQITFVVSAEVYIRW